MCAARGEAMARPLLIVISGRPCTGKTSLGRRLAAECGLPFLSKDAIKEQLFDTLGWEEGEPSRDLARASYSVLFYVTEELLRSGTSLIVESNFDARLSRTPLLEMMRRYGAAVFEISCQADPAVLLRRFRERARSGESHPGHLASAGDEEVGALLGDGRSASLELGGWAIMLDTTDLDAVDYASIEGLIHAATTGW